MFSPPFALQQPILHEYDVRMNPVIDLVEAMVRDDKDRRRLQKIGALQRVEDLLDAVVDEGKRNRRSHAVRSGIMFNVSVARR